MSSDRHGGLASDCGCTKINLVTDEAIGCINKKEFYLIRRQFEFYFNMPLL